MTQAVEAGAQPCRSGGRLPVASVPVVTSQHRPLCRAEDEAEGMIGIVVLEMMGQLVGHDLGQWDSSGQSRLRGVLQNRASVVRSSDLGSYVDDPLHEVDRASCGLPSTGCGGGRSSTGIPGHPSKRWGAIRKELGYGGGRARPSRRGLSLGYVAGRSRPPLLAYPRDAVRNGRGRVRG